MIKFKILRLPKLSKMLGKDIDGTRVWCKKYNVKIFSIDGKAFVFRCHAESVWIENLIIHLRTEYPVDWKRELKKYL